MSASTGSAQPLRDLRQFHFFPEPRSAEASFVPLWLRGALDSSLFQSRYPVFLGPPEAQEGAFLLSLSELVRRSAPESAETTGSTGVLADHLPDLERHVRQLAEPHTRPLDARELLEAAGQALVEESDETDEDGAQLSAALQELLAAIPAGGRLLPYSEQVPFHLLMHAAASRLPRPRSVFCEEARSVADQGKALLDAAGRGSSASENGSALGALGSRFIQPSSLAEVRTQTGGTDLESGTGLKAGTGLTAEQLEDVELACTTLGFLVNARPPEIFLVHDRHHGLHDLHPGHGWHLVEHEDPCAAAAELFDTEAQRVADVLRAVRRIGLHVEGRYKPELHDFWLDHFDWQAFSRDELQLLPPIVALLSADRVAGEGMVSLSRLLLSGRPVQVLVLAEPFSNPGSRGGESPAGETVEPLSSFRFEPAYLGLSHREALVQQTSPVRPDHMMQGFLRSLAATHTGLHVISAGADASLPFPAEVTAAAALEGRAHPLFHYDPEAGSSWADRFDFHHNPQPEEDWPIHPPAGGAGGGGGEPQAFTFADFALLGTSYAHHFQPVPDGVPDTELVPMAEYCSAPIDAEPSGIPFIRALDDESRPRRLAVSRALALACRDRLDFWRTLQELAALRTRETVPAAQEPTGNNEERAWENLDRMEAFYLEELQRVRRDAAREVADRLTAALFDGDVPAALPGPGAVTPTVPLQTHDADKLAAVLLQLVDPATLDEDTQSPEAVSI